MKLMKLFCISCLFTVTVPLINLSCRPSEFVETPVFHEVETDIGTVSVMYLILKSTSVIESPLCLCLRDDGDSPTLLWFNGKYYLVDPAGRRHNIKKKQVVWYDRQEGKHSVIATTWDYTLRNDEAQFSEHVVQLMTKGHIIQE